MSPLARVALTLAYAVLGLAAAGRSTVQLVERAHEAPLAYGLSAASAVLYMAIALALWRGWRTVALAGTAVELAGVLTVGTLGYARPELWPDETVWSGYGSGYGWVPLALPALALWALLRQRHPRPPGAAS